MPGTGDDPKKSDRVVNHLRSYITTQALRPGDRLPAERELAVQLSLTRGDVRRAIAHLAALGVLEVRHGIGAFLAETAPTPGSAPFDLLRASGSFEIWQLLEARRALESELVALAAERAQEPDLAPIANALAQMHAAMDDPGQFALYDKHFHSAIARAAGNPILAALMELLTSALQQERQRSFATRQNRTRALEYHQKIHKAIQRHNPEKAVKAMRNHLKSGEAPDLD